ncbi:MAG: hypothetical protein HUN04_23975 [Desulfobacter sp.]|nr:MAG: hypothetical protein HUN04_23975 [Desulfobacter sp.]
MKQFSAVLASIFVPVVILASGSLIVTGCLRYAAEHPEKSHEQFLKDKAYCENQAREYARLVRDQADYVDEVNHARQCMKGLGYKYRFRLSGWGSSAQETPKSE